MLSLSGPSSTAQRSPGWLQPYGHRLPGQRVFELSAGLVKGLIPAHLDLYFCDERHELIRPGTQERVKCAGFVHSKNIQ